jgi:hypothetical protein
MRPFLLEAVAFLPGVVCGKAPCSFFLPMAALFVAM